jgi:hypothetical protein
VLRPDALQHRYRAACVPLVRRFAETFAGFDAVVTPSASCAAMVRHHHATVAEESGDGALPDAVAEVAPRVGELAEFLVDDLGSSTWGALPHAVAFHPTCHSLRLLRSATGRSGCVVSRGLRRSSTCPAPTSAAGLVGRSR